MRLRSRRPALLLRGLSIGLAALVVGWAVLARQTSEQWWWVAATDLVPPQVLWPLFAALVWLAVRGRQWRWAVWNALLAAAFIVFQVGFMLPQPRPEARPGDLVLLTLNTLDANADAGRIAELARREGADVVTLQEALPKPDRQINYAAQLRAAFPGWTQAREGELLTLSRLPVLGRRTVRFPTSGHAVLSVRVQAQGGEVTVVNTHLPTLALLTDVARPGEPLDLPGRVAWRLNIRQELPGVMAQIRGAAPGAVLLAGDMNAPTHGELHRLLRGVGLHDAFSAVGAGFGFTYWVRLGFLRLDYVWGSGVTFVNIRALPDRLSDHRPLLARLRLDATVSAADPEAGEVAAPESTAVTP